MQESVWSKYLWLLYLDTSVISACFDKRNPERMSLTQQFWKELARFRIYISGITVKEINATPDTSLRNKLLHLIVPLLPPLQVTATVIELAEQYVVKEVIPRETTLKMLNILLLQQFIRFNTLQVGILSI